MGSRTAEEQKKAVCTSLVGVIRESSLRDQIDVRRFYAMVNDKFDRLCRNGVLDLEPIWSALSSKYAQEDLYGLFLRFAQVTENLGVQCRQAAKVEQLPQNSRSAYLSDFGQYVSSAGERSATPSAPRSSKIQGMGTPVGKLPSGIGQAAGMGTPVREKPQIGTDSRVAGLGSPISSSTNEAPSTQPNSNTADASEEIQRIGWAFAQSLKASLGEQANTGQLQYLITTHYASIQDGTTFDLNPILDTLISSAGNNKEGVYLGLIRFRSVLVGMGMEMVLPQLGLDPAVEEELLAEARTQKTDLFRAGGLNIGGADIGHLPGDAPVEKPLGPNKKDNQLAEFNLPGSQESSIKAKVLKGLAVTLLIVGLAITSWFVQPKRPLSLSNYNSVFPLTNVSTHNGIFVGYLDEYRWRNMTETDKQVAVQKLQTLLLKEGYLSASSKCQSMCRQVAIMDASDKLVVFDVSGGKLKNLTSK